MKSCDTCRWEDLMGAYCMQGHFMIFKKDSRINCHAWQEKEECWWCKEYQFFSFPMPELKARLNRVIGLDKDRPVCPICNRELKKEG